MENTDSNIKRRIREYPRESFFILAIAICYATLFPAIFHIPQDNTAGQIIGYYVSQLGVFSPVLAAIIITKIIQPARKPVSIIKRLSILIPVWLITTVINIANLKLTAPPQVPITGLIILSIPVALLPTHVILSAFSGAVSIRNLLSTFVKPKGKSTYYLLALLTFPFVHIIGNMISNLTNGLPLFPEINHLGTITFTILITFVSVLFFSGGLNEESGWRGFAQARLQSKYSPLGSSILLWVILVIWHIPNDLVQYQNGGYFEVRIVLYFFITILFTWTYNRTGGSILAVAIFHASMNSMNPLMGIFPITSAGNIMLIVFAIAVVFIDRMWQMLPDKHEAVYKQY